MVKIVPSHPHLIAEYQDEILESLNDEDMSIRMRALELTCSMVSTSLARHGNRAEREERSIGGIFERLWRGC